MTNQEVFDAVWEHFVTNEGKPGLRQSDNGKAGCAYLTEEGNRCAMGIFFPNVPWDSPEQQHSAEKFVGPLDDVFEIYAPVATFFEGVKPGLLYRLQENHDDAALHPGDSFTETFRRKLIITAEWFDLTIPEGQS